MQSQGTLPPKRDVARALLLRGSVFVHLDPRVDGVDVPPWLRDQAQLVLQVGLDLPLPIPDLRVDEAGVYGTLSFSRSPYTCTVPWDAVFAVVGEDGRGLVWPDSMPSEIAAEVEREAGERAPAPIGDPEAPGAEADAADEAGSQAGGSDADDAKVVRLDDRRPRSASTSLAQRDQAEESTLAEPESEGAPGAALTQLSEGNADGAGDMDEGSDEAAWGAPTAGDEDGALEGESDEPPKPAPAPSVSRDDGGKSKRRRDGQQDGAAEQEQARKRRRRRGQDLPPYLRIVK